MITRVAAVFFVSTLIPALAGAQRYDSIDLYSDAGFASTTAVDNVPGTLTVFVVHDPHGGNGDTVSSSFKISPSPGFTGVWLNENTPLAAYLGTSPEGIGIVYNNACFLVTSKLLLLTVTYTVFGTSAACSFLEVTSHPFFGVIDVQNCSFDTVSAAGGELTINPDATCSPLPIESMTWGGIKALYR